MVQTDNPDLDLEPLNHFTLASEATIGMQELWGSDMDSIAQSGLIWAQSMKITGLAPSASASGVVKYVSVPLGSLYSDGSTCPVTIRKLLAHVQRTEKFHGTVTLKNAIVQHNLVSRVNTNK